MTRRSASWGCPAVHLRLLLPPRVTGECKNTDTCHGKKLCVGMAKSGRLRMRREGDFTLSVWHPRAMAMGHSRHLHELPAAT